MDENELRDFFCPTAAIKMEIETGGMVKRVIVKTKPLIYDNIRVVRQKAGISE